MCVQVNLHVMQCLLGQLYKAPVTYLTQCEEWISHWLCTVPHERHPPEKTESEILKKSNKRKLVGWFVYERLIHTQCQEVL